MATYIMLSSVTDEGAKTIKDNAARIKEVNKELEEFGVKVTAQYAVLGPFDFVNVVEAPDDLTIARVSVALGARGSSKIESLTLVPVGEDQVADPDGNRQHLTVPADGEEGLGGHTHVVANEPLQAGVDGPLGPAR